MQKLINKIVLITGASSGIGQACAQQFAEQGARLILAARRLDRLLQLTESLEQQYGTKILVLQLDVQDGQAVKKLLSELPEEWSAIDILVNNAGLAVTLDKLQDGDPANWDRVIDTNVKGLLYVTHAVLPGMIARNRGHIVNLGSVAGHECYLGGNVYSASKFAVNAINKSLLIDLLGTAIRVTSIDPGAVETEFTAVRFDDKERSAQFYGSFTPLQAADIADAVLYCVTRPPHVKIAEMVIFPTDQASANHLNRRQ